MTQPVVRYLRKIGGTPVEALAHYAINEQFEKGWRDPTKTVPGTGWGDEGLFVDVNGVTVSMLGFSRTEWNRTIKTNWSYTLIPYRRQGFNKTLFDALLHIAKRDGYHSILRTTHVANTPMISAFEKAGGKPSHIDYRFATDADVGISLNDRFEFP